MTGGYSFTLRLTSTLALLLVAFGIFMTLLGRHVAAEHEQESLQRLSHGLARHIVDHWPEIAVSDPDQADREARAALLAMLTVVNPGVQAYVLDVDGNVSAYIGEPGMVREAKVALDPIRRFLAGATLPLRGTDPMGSGIGRVFSAAMFPPRPGDPRPPGYLYVVLDGQARQQVARQVSLLWIWQGAGIAIAVALLLTIAVGTFTFWRHTRPLQRLAGRIRGYHGPNTAQAHAATKGSRSAGDEVKLIGEAMDDMIRRIESQARLEKSQSDGHREMMAAIAHDLRTPLTALHGQLEALAQRSRATGVPLERGLAAALSQSDRIRRLTQQLFELAALQAGDQVLHRERFCLDELVTDAVQKFDAGDAAPKVMLSSRAPGRLELDGDLQLIERALDNLIDNAIRHGRGDHPVRVSLRRDGRHAQILIEDPGPGLPMELRLRLESGSSLRDPPVARRSGGIGGLGLAIAQRVADLHGGSLRPLPAPHGGTRLCLALPLA